MAHSCVDVCSHSSTRDGFGYSYRTACRAMAGDLEQAVEDYWAAVRII